MPRRNRTERTRIPAPGGVGARVGLRGLVKARFLRFRREIVVVALAIRHPGTPLHLRLGGLLLLAYLASPVDLIPLFVPVLGVVDDLLLVPWGLSRITARLPEAVRVETEARAARFIERWVRRPLVFLAVLLAGLALSWILLLALFWHLVLR